MLARPELRNSAPRSSVSIELLSGPAPIFFRPRIGTEGLFRSDIGKLSAPVVAWHQQSLGKPLVSLPKSFVSGQPRGPKRRAGLTRDHRSL